MATDNRELQRAYNKSLFERAGGYRSGAKPKVDKKIKARETITKFLNSSNSRVSSSNQEIFAQDFKKALINNVDGVVASSVQLLNDNKEIQFKIGVVVGDDYKVSYCKVKLGIDRAKKPLITSIS